MPELPEVETMRRRIAAAVGAVIARIARPPSRLRAIEITPSLPVFRRRSVGRTIERIDRLGKRIVLVLDSCDRIVIEPRMTGLVLLADPPDRKHLRLMIELEHPGRVRGAKPLKDGALRTEEQATRNRYTVGRRLRATHHMGDGSVLHAPYAIPEPKQILLWDQRGLGVIRLVSPKEFDRIYGPGKIGPDALSISSDELRARLRHSRRAIKVALLDQKALAGVGNLYASEILHRAGVHPSKTCSRLRRDQWQRIHVELNNVLHEAIEHQGSTLRDGTYRIARDAPGNFQFRHRVYQRHGQPCFACGRSQIVRIVQAQRSTFFCPTCQRK
jgi:formamidopyrimidine-DNA glycosylase